MAALVGDVVILRSDVDRRARMHLAGEREALHLGPVPEALLAAALEELVGEVLLAREARASEAREPSREARRRALRQLESIAGGSDRTSALLRALGAERAELEEAALRRAWAAAFLEAQIGREGSVSDAEVLRVYESGDHPFVGQSFDTVTEALRVWITRQRLSRAVDQWVRTLRARARIHYAVDWE